MQCIDVCAVSSARANMIGAREGNATGRGVGSGWIEGVTIFRLSLALSFAGHAAALALVAWLGTMPLAIPDQPAPHTIPLIFIEQSPPTDQTTPDTAASEPLRAAEQSPSSSPVVEESPSSNRTGPAPPMAAASEPNVALHSSMPTEPASATEFPTEEPVPIPREKPPPPPEPKPVAQSRTQDRPEIAPEPVPRTPDNTNAVSWSKPAKPHIPATASVSAQAARGAHKPPSRSDAGPTVTRQDTPPPVPARTGMSATEQIAAVRPSAAVALPRSASPQISAEYRTALSTWLQRNKVYPDVARRRGEQGSAILRFRVGRDGRVLAYHLVRSTGYATLDAAVDEMMRGAVLPPFPASMTQPEIAVSVPIRFSLSG
jgi:periplasmic protein TonB